MAVQDRAGTLAYQVYGQTEISERHRHRYEFNREYEETMVATRAADFRLDSGRTYVEMVEIPVILIHRMPVSSGVQVEAAGAASAV